VISLWLGRIASVLLALAVLSFFGVIGTAIWTLFAISPRWLAVPVTLLGLGIACTMLCDLAYRSNR
jgi:hypothetical protein